MSNNITTVPMLPDAEGVGTEDTLYLVQGTGSDRDRKATLAAILECLQKNFGVVECKGLAVKDGGTLALTVHDSQAGDITLEMKPYSTQQDKTYRISLTGSLSALRIAQRLLLESGLAVEGDAEVSGTLKAKTIEGTNTGTSGTYLVINNLTVSGDLDVKGNASLGNGLLRADYDGQNVEVNGDADVSGTMNAAAVVSSGTLLGTSLQLPKKGSSPYGAIDSAFYKESDANTYPATVSTGAVAGMFSFVRNSGSAQIRVYLGIDPATTSKRYCLLNAGCVGMFLCHSTSDEGSWWSPMYNATIQLES